jgi:hypothetical protein
MEQVMKKEGMIKSGRKGTKKIRGNEKQKAK